MRQTHNNKRNSPFTVSNGVNAVFSKKVLDYSKKILTFAEANLSSGIVRHLLSI